MMSAADKMAMSTKSIEKTSAVIVILSRVNRARTISQGERPLMATAPSVAAVAGAGGSRVSGAAGALIRDVPSCTCRVTCRGLQNCVVWIR